VSSLSLSKWYLDCVDDAGNVCIAYWARLAWKKLSIAYSSVLFDGASRDHLFAIAAPRLDGDRLTWSAPPLDVEVSMRRLMPAYEELLIDGVTWRCEMPSADTVITCNGTTLRGCGYAELLQLEVAPWKLPIDELRWGRFAGAGAAMTWIEWRGQHPLTRTLVNGVRDDAATTKLTTHEPRLIRDALLGDTLTIPGLVLPRRIARAREVKWCARATMTDGDRIVDRGWAVYETVSFG